MRVLITGGCGFVGSSLALACRAAGHEVICLDSLMRRGSELLLERIQAVGATFVHGDIRQSDDLARVGPVDVLLECSAEPSVLAGTRGDGARYMVDTNLGGCVHCLEFARRTGCGLIFLSSSRVYPYDYLLRGAYAETAERLEYAGGLQGVSPAGVSTACPLDGRRSLYGATKLAGELLLQEYADAFGVTAIINRCGVIAGPWQLGRSDQGFAAFWMARHYFNLPLRYIGFGGSGKQVRDILHIDDLCALIGKQLAVLDRFRGEVFNAGGGRPGSVSLCEATAICRSLTGRVLAITSEPANLPADIPWFITDSGQVVETFDWRPMRPAEQVFADIYRWIRENEPLARRIFTAAS
jgi:CDP-paratose 2-epimerase